MAIGSWCTGFRGDSSSGKVTMVRQFRSPLLFRPKRINRRPGPPSGSGAARRSSTGRDKRPTNGLTSRPLRPVDFGCRVASASLLSAFNGVTQRSTIH
jgi:hypothetical protein